MRVLVVEDAPRLANWIAEGLRDQGIAVDIAYDGTEAASKLNLNPYDVVVLDRDLPGIHGDTLCQMITESDEPAMILMLTAAGAPDERVTGLALGADDYLPKPFHFPELVLRVRALARRKPTAHSRTLRAARNRARPDAPATSLETAARSTLTPKERAVLEALLESQPRRPQRREAPRAGMGRERRPVHQHRPGHDRQAAPQTRRAPDHPNDARHRVSHRKHRQRTGLQQRRVNVAAIRHRHRPRADRQPSTGEPRTTAQDCEQRDRPHREVVTNR